MNYINNLVRMSKEFSTEYGSGMVGMSTSIHGNGEVHLREKTFMEHFKNYETATRQCERYPVTHFVIVHNVKFFCISEEDNK